MNQELKQYVETTIIPKYEMFDKAHNRTHVCTVIAESLITGKRLPPKYEHGLYHSSLP